MSKGAPDYSKITLIKGAAPDGSLVTIAVDASGQILAVLKGDYLGTPTTIAVDANGHMLANIYDPDDLFGNTSYIGLAELAARLGSVMNYDRRGQIVWNDSFESATKKWYTAYSGTGGAAALSTADAYLLTQCLKLTAGSDSLKISQMTRYILAMSYGRMGFEIAYSFVDPAVVPSYVRFEVWQYNGTNFRHAGIRHDIANWKLQYLNSSDAWTDFSASFEFYNVVQFWAKLKFVVDFTTGKYVRIMYGNQTIDMSTLSCVSGTSSVAANVQVQNTVVGPGTTNPAVYFDDFILTMNEP